MSPASASDQFAELCSILLAAERGELADLKRRMEDPERRAQEVAGVLAEAIKLRAAGDKKLRNALQSTIEDALGIAVTRNPRMIASALYPIFGKAIRKAISAELDGMMQSLSQVLEQSFSLRSLQWRMEALRTRRPYAEIVLLRSLLYRVEQVFLIHRSTGLLLLHAESGSTSVKDPEMVSGMLTAIQDFVRDVISGAESENLETVRMGDFTVVLAYGPGMILAGFVRGVAPRKLDQLFQDELDAIHEEQGAVLAGFKGDTSKFDSSRPRLEKCLVGQGDMETGGSRGSRAVLLLLAGIAWVLVAGGLWWWVSAARAEAKWRDLVERIGAQPGIVITGYGQRDGKRSIAGLRDPLAADPSAMTAEAGLPAGQVDFRWEPYHSLQPPFAEQRRYAAAKAAVESGAIGFAVGDATIPAGERAALGRLAGEIQAMVAAARPAGREVRIEILGSTDLTGKTDVNVPLARDRAVAVEEALAALGIPREIMTARGLTSPCGLSRDRNAGACRTAALRVLEVGRRP
jgi:outer membrane protein OmpA-like peptidoglycan-associated protein